MISSRPGLLEALREGKIDAIKEIMNALIEEEIGIDPDLMFDAWVLIKLDEEDIK